jgi:hypothetical protein
MTLRPRDRIALVVILMLALAGAYYLLALKPEQQKASKLSSAITSQRQALSTAEANYAAGKAAQESIKANAPEWAALGKAVPDKSDIPALLRILERNADAVHVKMKAITITPGTTSPTTASPSTTAPTTASPSTTGTTTGTTGVAGTATTVPISLTFAGGYTALNKLVHRLDGLVVVSRKAVHATGPLLSISSVSLTGAPLTVQLSATIYQLAGASTAATTTTGGQS